MIKNLKIAAMLVTGFIIMIVIMIGISAISMNNVNLLASYTQILYRGSLMGLQSIEEIGQGLADERGYLLLALSEQDAFKQKQALDGATASGELIKEKLAVLSENYQKEADANEIASLDALAKRVTESQQLRVKIQNLIASGDLQSAFSICVNEYSPQIQSIQLDLAGMQRVEATQAENYASNSAYMNKRMLFWLLGIVAFATVLSILILFVLIRAIRRPVNELVKVAKRVAQGDVDVTLTYASKNEFGSLAASITEVIGNLRRLVGEAKTLTDATSSGDFNARADADSFGGGYRAILAGVNSTLDTVVDKVFWYESMIDSMPSPLLVFDNDLKYTMVNQKVCDYLGLTKEALIGKTSTNTEGFEQFIKHNNVYSFMKLGASDLRFAISYLYDRNGEKVGFVETGTDITKDNRKAIYQQAEVERLAKNLNLLSLGLLNFDLAVASADEYTQEDRENFLRIADTLKTAQENLSSYIGETAAVLNEVAKGNLNVSVNGDFKGEFVQIKESMNKIIDALNDMLAQINQASNQVLSGSGQVASASQALSQGSTEQASSVEELSATIEDISAQIKKTAGNAQDAQSIAVGAAKTIESLNQQMDTMMGAMGNISESSQKISKIIKTIDEIAFQTNILALNAAVEAARAGEAGKGFAVVADEVRNLASKSADAAKDTAALIESSITAVEEGTHIAGETAKTLAVIVSEATKSGQIIGEISEASKMQAIAINQTTQGVSQISAVVQTNSATAEESAAASEELSGQADMLNDLVSRFQLRSASAGSGNEKPQKQKQWSLDLTLPQGNSKY